MSKTTDITKPIIQKALTEAGLDLRVGDQVIDRDGRIFRILEIMVDRDNDSTLKIKIGECDENGKADRAYGDVRLSRFEVCEFVKLPKPLKELENDLADALLHPEKYDVSQSESDNIDSESSLVAVGSKDSLQSVMSDLEERKKMVTVMKYLVQRRLSGLNAVVSSLTSKIVKVQKVIDVLELYLGVYEEILQIQEGGLAPAGTPISIRQMVLYMDEEAGDPRPRRNGQRGIEYTSIKDFDDWLLEDGNYKNVLPEEKGLVVICPSRQDRKYDDNPIISQLADDNNHYAYFLIRNGENIYRVWSSISISGKLFPSPQEFTKELSGEDIDSSYFTRERFEDKTYEYKRNAVIIQGLIDRTQVFEPIPHVINIFKPESYEDGSLNLIYDAEASLRDGHMPYGEWKDHVNAKVGVGSRILLVSPYRVTSGYCKRDFRDRFLRYYSDSYNCPFLPETGVYEVVEIVEKKWGNIVDVYWRILYNPGGKVYGSWYRECHERKNKVSFLVSPKDAFAINYDQIDVEDVEYFINDRLERRNYLSVIPVMWDIRDILLEEKEKESHFVRLVAGRLQCTEDEVWDAVNWWKFKNKWKRPLSKDDAKALRMIEGKIRREGSSIEGKQTQAIS